MVKGESRVEIYNPDGSLNSIHIGATPKQIKEHLNDRKFCPPGCTVKVGVQ